MASIPLEMDDIFGNYEEAEDFNPSRLPDLEDELEPMRDTRSDEDNNEGNMAAEDQDNIVDDPELLAKLKSMKGASKHTTKKSYPKLDATRLTGERGIATLPKIFKDVPLKGKNNEAEDLKIIMRHLEHWAHRLFPKMPFDEVLERSERLGSQKEVQTCVKKIRLDMPVLMSDHVEDYDDVNRVGPETEGGDEERARESVSQNEINEDEIEELLREQEQITSSQATPQQSFETSSKFTASPPTQSMSLGMSDEMRERIERNKKLAMEKRAARLAKMNQGNIEAPVVEAVSKTTENGDPQVVQEWNQAINNSDSQPDRGASQATDTNDPQVASEERPASESDNSVPEIVREESQATKNSDPQSVSEESQATDNIDPQVASEESQAIENSDVQAVNEESQATDNIDPQVASEESQAIENSDIQAVNEESRATENSNPQLVREECQAIENCDTQVDREQKCV